MAGSKKEMRLDRFLVSQDIGSRKEVSQLIRSGIVTVNGEKALRPERKIIPGVDVVVAGKDEVIYIENIYIMMNKPAGVLSAAEDSRVKTVLDILPPEMRRRGLFPAGRLDKDSTGLLIITNDGDFAHKMLAPKSYVYKTYEVVTEHPVTEDDIAAFASGIRTKTQDFAPAQLWVEKRDEITYAMVKIHEGKYHQVKRMFLARSNKVLLLKRVQIGALKLDDNLEEGAARYFQDGEIYKIFNNILY